MNKLILAGAAALALAIPASAQELAVAADGDVYVLSPSQKPIYDAWPLERRSGYDAWPNTYKNYYWTLPPTQQDAWFMLDDEQRARMLAMTPDARTQAWAAIEQQMDSRPSANASATARAATTAAAGGTSGEPRFVSGEVLQTTTAATRANGQYPLCSATVQDSCVNPREAGKNYGNRPLNYWPGKPASEIPGKKPQN